MYDLNIYMPVNSSAYSENLLSNKDVYEDKSNRDSAHVMGVAPAAPVGKSQSTDSNIKSNLFD